MSKLTAGVAQAAPAPRRSGVNITEAERGTVQLKLRVEESIVGQLDALVARAGGLWNRSSFVAALVDSETNRAKRRTKKAEESENG